MKEILNKVRDKLCNKGNYNLTTLMITKIY